MRKINRLTNRIKELRGAFDQARVMVLALEPRVQKEMPHHPLRRIQKDLSIFLLLGKTYSLADRDAGFSHKLRRHEPVKRVVPQIVLTQITKDWPEFEPIRRAIRVVQRPCFGR
ncbi:hypothetical protein RAZWK3B_01040 [Roseobacter sp. AzwK-3b]|nr:hypothetical protein RAZWK3B_01040 [Roseobacter sp. AzwK-3b]